MFAEAIVLTPEGVGGVGHWRASGPIPVTPGWGSAATPEKVASSSSDGSSLSPSLLSSSYQQLVPWVPDPEPRRGPLHQSLLGYIRLSSFSANAPQEVARAIQRLEKAGADHYVLDLRSNPGGLVQSGLEIARMWLPGGSTLLHTLDREGEAATVTLAGSSSSSSRSSLGLGGGLPGSDAPPPTSSSSSFSSSSSCMLPGQLTSDPLVVLVDHASASASEILAGALQDNGRALVLGDSPTFGKGKIQSVFPLSDGSAVFVTVARYQTPLRHQIDGVGIRPDGACGLDATAAVPRLTVIPDSPTLQLGAEVPVGAKEGGGAYFGPGGGQPGSVVVEDSCVLRAAQVISAGAGTATAPPANGGAA